MTDDTTLSEYGVESDEPIPPLVHRKAVVWSPTKPDTPVGFLGLDRRRDYRVYTTRRKSYHYYQKGEGYAISDAILGKLEKAGASRILIWTPDDNVYEFGTYQYRTEGEPVPEHDLLEESDPQTYVPVAEAINSWSPLSCRGLHVEEFGEAMGRLESKSGW